jgi:hypothetical protein
MPGYEWREPVLLIDGVVTREVATLAAVTPGADAELVDLGPDEVASIRIACWNPATDSFRQNGIPIIRIHTKKLVEATREPLLWLIRAQEQFRSRHERYAADLEALVEFGLDPDTALEFEGSASGWHASTPSGDIAYRCSANDRSGGSLGEDGEPRLDCSPVDTLALRSLRALYDAGR